MKLKITTLLILFVSLSHKTKAQENNFTFETNSNYNTLLYEKQKLKSLFTIYRNYSVQLEVGNKKKITATYTEFRKQYPNTDVSITYSELKYRLIAGNFKHKISAEKFAQELKNKYNTALVIKNK